MPRTAPLDTLLAAALLLAVTSGCAPLASEVRARRLQAELDAVRLEQPLDEIWAKARHLLGERHFGLVGKDAEAEGQDDQPIFSLFTPAKETSRTRGGGRRLETGWGDRRVRYALEAIPDGTGWRVQYTAISESRYERKRDGDRRRDPDLELELVRAFAPEKAGAVLQHVEGPAVAPAERPIAPPAS